jgi:hypothetical protein
MQVRILSIFLQGLKLQGKRREEDGEDGGIKRRTRLRVNCQV